MQLLPRQGDSAGFLPGQGLSVDFTEQGFSVGLT